MEWITITQDRPDERNDGLKDNDLIAYDNGEIRRWKEQPPFAIAVAFLITPEYEQET